MQFLEESIKQPCERLHAADVIREPAYFALIAKWKGFEQLKEKRQWGRHTFNERLVRIRLLVMPLETSNIAQAGAFGTLNSTMRELNSSATDNQGIFAEAKRRWFETSRDDFALSIVFGLLAMAQPLSEPPQIYHGDFEVESYFLQWSKETQESGGVASRGVTCNASDEEFLVAMRLKGRHGLATLEWMKVRACF